MLELSHPGVYPLVLVARGCDRCFLVARHDLVSRTNHPLFASSFIVHSRAGRSFVRRDFWTNDRRVILTSRPGRHAIRDSHNQEL